MNAKTIMNAKNRLISETEQDVAWHYAGKHSCLIFPYDIIDSKYVEKWPFPGK